MAILSEQDRLRVWRGLNRIADDRQFSIAGISKQDVRDAVDTTDDWIEANQASFNSVLPAVVQSSLSATDKTLLFCAIAAMRVSPNFARRLLGVID